MNAKKPCIEVSHLQFAYGDDVILEDISFTVFPGDYLGILGPNGGGKTTLLKILLGLLKPTSGTVKLFGQEIHHFDQWPRLGYVPQRVHHGDWDFPATVLEIISSARTGRYGWRRLKVEDRSAIHNAIQVTGVENFQHQLLGTLSGGQRQRVFIARALATKPDILILDEPTVGVDAPTQERFYEFLRTIRKHYRVTILFVTHDVDVLAGEVSYVLCLNRQLICHSPLKEFIKEEYMEQMFGKNMRSIFHGHQ